MPRAMWKGAITFGLVTVPVNLYSATQREGEVRFRLIHKTDAAPVDYRRYCSAENVEVQWSDIAKGYDPREMKLTGQLIDTLAGPWRPEKYHDADTETLQKAIEQKLAGQEIHIPTPGQPPKVVDLMQALQASLKEGGRRPPAKANGRRAPQAAPAPARGRRRKAS